ncbi:MAG: bifunctional phosphopantothenoylcysteine decarboxylase/phosphopantothenate--cysteine ligase CoaBC [Candidatus Promineifilaceae bacterium]
MTAISLLRDKRILLGVTGSIAAYKSADLASKLAQAGALVDVILTESALRFVSGLTFRSLTGRPAYSDLWDLDDHVRHVRLAEAADLLLIAPATAQTIANLAHGIADNLLAVAALAVRCPLLVAPAMDGGMYAHPAVQANLKLLAERGALLPGPAEGHLASGLSGAGRMLEPAALLGHVRLALGRGGPLRSRQVVVTAGPTHEAIDPVRYLGNRSSAKQGFALAQAALDAGAQVTLISGPAMLEAPVGATLVPVVSAAEMCAQVLELIPAADALLMAAAVADFRPAAAANRKIKKGPENADGLNLRLERTADVLEAVKEARQRGLGPRLVVGFAAETGDALASGRQKLAAKGVDLLVVNDVSAPDAGFDVDTNRVTLLTPGGLQEEPPLMSKAEVAERIIGWLAQTFAEDTV